jgi:surface-anchored protein
MIRIVLIMFLSVAPVFAHDHVEVGKATQNATQLAMDGPGVQVAVYVPRGEPFSGYMPNFPGGHHAVELTFTTEINSSALYSAANANPRIELVSVTGPPGGGFSFWEVDATQPTWTRAAGWSSAQGNVPSFPVVVNGDDHVHGRCFTMGKPGTYTVTFRAVASVGSLSPSANKTITFQAQQPPQLSIATSGSNVLLSFTNRDGFACDLQVSTNLVAGSWTNIPAHEFMIGSGARTNLTLINGLIGRTNAFYRLVEY